jgi:intracellular septation protein
MDEPAQKTENQTQKFLIDFGPLVIFIIAYAFSDVYWATGIFMAATALAMGYSWITTRHISGMLLFSGAMVLIFGSLTLYLHDETFIKMKPTIYYALISSILLFGTLRGQPTIKAVMAAAYPELSDKGWAILNRNFGLFFIAMAIINELVWRNSSTGFWMGYKLWGAFPATLLFSAAHVPMILRESEDSE